MSTPEPRITGLRHYARGYLVARLQTALSIPADGMFGNITCTAVRAMQTLHKLEPNGIADEPLHAALRLSWPTEFERILALVDQFEGTGFGGINRDDIDGFGVTLGIIGFTSHNGEVQDLLREYYRISPGMINAVKATRRVHLLDLINNSNSQHRQWETWFYGGDGIIDPDIRTTVATWGKDAQFQQLQMNRVRNRYWDRALADAAKLGLTSMQGRAIMFDVAVQNGGWRDDHQKLFNADSHDGRELSKLRAIAGAVAACAHTAREAVYNRKMIIATGKGVVNQANFDIQNYAFEILN